MPKMEIPLMKILVTNRTEKARRRGKLEALLQARKKTGDIKKIRDRDTLMHARNGVASIGMRG